MEKTAKEVFNEIQTTIASLRAQLDELEEKLALMAAAEPEAPVAPEPEPVEVEPEPVEIEPEVVEVDIPEEVESIEIQAEPEPVQVEESPEPVDLSIEIGRAHV